MSTNYSFSNSSVTGNQNFDSVFYKPTTGIGAANVTTSFKLKGVDIGTLYAANPNPDNSAYNITYKVTTSFLYNNIDLANSFQLTPTAFANAYGISNLSNHNFYPATGKYR